jgi:SAM-dependent methyltransferase
VQITTGIRAVLSIPAVYDMVQNLAGARRNRREFVSRYVEPSGGHVVLDIGCGTGQILDELPRVSFFGVDISRDYIDQATARYGPRGTFVCGELSRELVAELPPIDRVIMHGVLHHMSDDVALDVMRIASSKLASGGRFVSIDPTYSDGQSRIARFVISRDRGQSVRTPEGYRSLAAQVFGNVEVVVRHDLNRIPYTHAILRCSNS